MVSQNEDNSSSLKKKKKKLLREEEGVDSLPDTYQVFSQANWKEKEKSEKICKLCHVTFNAWNSDKSRHHCRRCGIAVCTTCSANQKRLSKADSESYKVCDRCDFEIANPYLM